jgi:hypothetical protein
MANDCGIIDSAPIFKRTRAKLRFGGIRVVADILKKVEAFWCRGFVVAVDIAADQAAARGRSRLVLPNIHGGSRFLNPELVIHRKHAALGAIAADFEAATGFGFNRHQDACA